jgi:protein-disulfide isomerase
MFRKSIRLVLAGVICSMLCSGAYAVGKANFSPSQVNEIEKIVHDYLVVKNPQVLVEASTVLQKQATEKAKVSLQGVAETYKNEIFDLAIGRPTAGKDHGDVLVAEFFDNQCGHCKQTHAIVDKAIKANPNLQVVFIDWPFFGKDSAYAAKLGFAAIKQNKYYELHSAFMAAENPLNQAKADELAKSVGLDVNKLQQDLKANDKEYEKILQTNFALAKKMKLEGIPAFVIADKDMKKFMTFPGDPTQEEFLAAIESVAK